MSKPTSPAATGAAPMESSSQGSVSVDAVQESPARMVRGTRSSPGGPKYCVWEITLRCDLGCKHCGSRAGKPRPEELTTAQCVDVVRELDELGIREVTLIGGEAYLRDDWDVIASAITKRGMSCGMTTGARQLTQERVARAEAAGLRTISISIDGLERTHDAQRGVRGSFRAATEAAERVAQSSIRLATNTQINKLSMPELPALADLLRELGSKAWQVQLTVPMGRAADRPDLLLQPFDLLELFPLLVWIKNEKLTPHGIRLFPGNNIGYFGPYEQALRYGGANGTHWSSCGAGSASIGLEADGKIKGCPSLPSAQYTGGYLGRDGLRETVEQTDALTSLGRRSREDLWGFCRTCYYGDICLAGCSWTGHVFMGRPGNNPYCIHRQLEHEKQGQQERLLRRQPAPGEPFDHGVFESVLEPLSDRPEATILEEPVARMVNLPIESGGFWDAENPKRRLQIVPA